MSELYGKRYIDDLTPSDFLDILQNHLPHWDFWTAMQFYTEYVPYLRPCDVALLGCNDRFYLLTGMCNRVDAVHPWLYDRCREVEADTDGYIDLWARAHYKSTIITFAGIIQEIMRDPNITIGIFSNTLEVSQPFLEQIANELRTNDTLLECYSDVLWQSTNERKKAFAKWSVGDGIVVKRTSNAKEATVEAHGLIDAMPTGRHFALMVFDDVVNEKNVTNEEQIRKATERFELADNLGNASHLVSVARKWIIGTRYHFGDTYGIMIDREIAKVRLYPATDNGRIDGRPIFLTEEGWALKVKTQRSTVAAQMLQNPLAGKENTFRTNWLRPYFRIPTLLNVYILCDPSLGQRVTSDRTAMAVIGIDINNNKYLLDGFCHRMSLSEKWHNLSSLYAKWMKMPCTRMLEVGYERYGYASDLQYFEERMLKERINIDIVELNWTGNKGEESKKHRVQRLEPDFRNGDFFIPGKVWHSAKEGDCRWAVDTEREDVVYIRMKSRLKVDMELRKNGEHWRIVKPIKRKDEDDHVYDLVRILFEEYRFFPFSPRDDLIDAVSRYFDMDPVAPVPDMVYSDEELRDDYVDA